MQFSLVQFYTMARKLTLLFISNKEQAIAQTNLIKNPIISLINVSNIFEVINTSTLTLVETRRQPTKPTLIQPLQQQATLALLLSPKNHSIESLYFSSLYISSILCQVCTTNLLFKINWIRFILLRLRQLRRYLGIPKRDQIFFYTTLQSQRSQIKVMNHTNVRTALEQDLLYGIILHSKSS